MNIKTLLTDEEIRDLTDKVHSSHWLTLGEKVGLLFILGLQDAKTKRVIVEWVEKLGKTESGLLIIDPFWDEWQEFKKWVLGE